MINYIYTNIESLFLLFMFYAISGWIIEVVGKLATKHRFINRGFLIGPYCPIYGWGAVIITVLLKDYVSNIFILFVMSMMICSVIEYLTSYFMEKAFKVRWWDYSQKKFNLNGRVCLDFAVLFGVGGVLIVKVINPFVLDLIYKLPINIIHIISISLFVIIMLDNVISGIIIRSFKNLSSAKAKDATETISLKVKETMEQYTDKVTEDIKLRKNVIAEKIEAYRISKTEELKKELSKKSFLHRRLINAFPGATIKNKKDQKLETEIIKKNK